MSYSLRQLAGEAVRAQPTVTWVRAQRLAKSWERRNRGAFLSGYLGVEGIDRLVVTDRTVAGESLKVLLAERVAAAG